MDLDIDAVTLLGSEFDDSGKYVMWSPLADISSIEKLEASLNLAFPTGKETLVEIDNKKESFFVTNWKYIMALFTLKMEKLYVNGVEIDSVALDERGYSEVVLKTPTAENLKLLAEFIDIINESGISIKGDVTNSKHWKATKEAQKEWKEFKAKTTDSSGTFMLEFIGVKTLDLAYEMLEQIKDIVNKHNLYSVNASKRTREMMAKNHCQWAMYLVCSTASNLTELMTGVDVATDPIKNSKTGAVAQSPDSDADNYTATGSYLTIFKSFQEGQTGKQCVGIGAVSIKVNSTCQYYMDLVLRSNDNAHKLNLLFPKVDAWGNRDENGERGYLIGGIRRNGLANLYDKSSEGIQEEFEITRKDGITVKLNMKLPEEILKLMAENLVPEDLTPNVAMSLAAMLSVAVDRS